MKDRWCRCLWLSRIQAFSQNSQSWQAHFFFAPFPTPGGHVRSSHRAPSHAQCRVDCQAVCYARWCFRRSALMRAREREMLIHLPSHPFPFSPASSAPSSDTLCISCRCHSFKTLPLTRDPVDEQQRIAAHPTRDAGRLNIFSDHLRITPVFHRQTPVPLPTGRHDAIQPLSRTHDARPRGGRDV